MQIRFLELIMNSLKLKTFLNLDNLHAKNV